MLYVHVALSTSHSIPCRMISWIKNSVLQLASVVNHTACLGSGWEDESIVAGRSMEDSSFRESLERDDSSNVMHERRKPFMRSTEALYVMDHLLLVMKILSLKKVLNQRSPRGKAKEIYFENFSWCKTQSKALRSHNFTGDSEKSSLSKDILDEDDHLMDFN
ncbi:uncharacterized protein LOC129872047 [Solanum dulcamara]|uniref:uncharacterized protein LOC129872047 n=1 Tax=Solanum dulcamara TaxID=45834 RepID=UPI0024864858|nr:uncharacterized protein LOC129872047 [Solanum dulcamara]